MSSEDKKTEAEVFPAPDPRLLKPHIRAKHDLIPLNRPDAVRDGRPVGKAPLEQNWTTRDYSREDFAAWMARGHNVGVRLRDDQVVIDVDPRNFDGADRLVQLCETFELKPGDYPVVRTGGGGQHLYAAKPSDIRLSVKLEDFPGVEFKSRGTQVVAGGSVHPESKRHYRVEDPFDDLVAPPPLPLALLEALRKDRPRQESDDVAPLSPSQLADLLATLNPASYREYKKWLDLMMACHHGTAGEGIEEFAAWSIGDPIYADHEPRIRDAWMRLKADFENGITIKTLFRAVSDAGHADLVAAIGRKSAAQDFAGAAALPAELDLATNRRGDPVASLANCLAALSYFDIGLAYDELSRRPVLRSENLPWNIDVGREVNEDVLRTIRHFLLVQAGIEFSKEDVIEASLTLARERPFNPVIEYLDAVEWDGTRRLDDWLVTYLGAEDNEFNRAVGRLVLIAAVRRAKSPGCKFDYVLILEGKQGTGKSSALAALGGEWHSDAELGRLDSKEAPQLLQGVWIHELGELTAMGRSEVEDLKAFVSRQSDRYRGPYERLARSEPRRCIFIGTTNAESYLFDETGNRRFWPVRTTRIDLASLRMDRDQLWAEAVEAEREGESIALPPHLWKLAAQEQQVRLAGDPWKDQIAAWLERQPRDRVHTQEIFDWALGIDASRQNQHVAKRVRQVMASIGGWTYKHGIRIEGRGTAAGYQKDGS